jgi:uncharacterized membrane protein
MAAKTNSPASANGQTPNGPVAESIAEVVELGRREQRELGFSERLAQRITFLSGTMLFVTINAIWFAVWIIINSGITPLKPFDPFPFTFLTMMVSLEAIFLSIFILITEIQQSGQADRRAQFDLQVNMVAEREVTAILKQLKAIEERLGIEPVSRQESEEMVKTTRLGKLIDETEAAEAEQAETPA